MKKLTLALVALCAAVAFPAVAQTVCSTTPTASQTTRLTRRMNKENKATCLGLYLAVGCTQTQARNAWCVQNGGAGTSAPCTIGGVSSTAAVKVYADACDFVDRFVIGDWLARLKVEQDSEDLATAKATWDAMTQEQKDADCVQHGLAAGCVLWP